VAPALRRIHLRLRLEHVALDGAAREDAFELRGQGIDGALEQLRTEVDVMSPRIDPTFHRTPIVSSGAAPGGGLS
jgi:hypothetical protein